MKHIKKFNESFKIEDNIVVCDNLPEPSKEGDVQEMGFNPDQLVQGPDDSLSYGYTTSIDDIPEEDAKKFIDKHIKSFSSYNED